MEPNRPIRNVVVLVAGGMVPAFLALAVEELFFDDAPAWVWFLSAGICLAVVTLFFISPGERRKWAAEHGEIVSLLREIYWTRTTVIALAYGLLLGGLVIFIGSRL